MHPQRIGPYLLHERIGRGGTGLITKAWDENAGMWVAIKSIPPDRLSPTGSECLRAEARTVASIDHPAVARVHGIVNHGGQSHIVMELVEGRPLTELLGDGPIEVGLAVELAGQLAEGLDAAHRCGLVHGDLKPDNVMVVDGPKVKILDFGLAVAIADQVADRHRTGSGVVVGTARAMSPEQATGRPIDHRSDLFSLGTLLYHMVTGDHPFAAGDPFETMHNIAYQHPPPVHFLNPKVPQELSDLIESLLGKRPEDRPSSTADVARSLRELLPG